MPIYKAKNTFRHTKCFVNLHQDIEMPMQYVRTSGNNISVIDEDGRILEEYYSNSKILPVNLSNDQVCERAMIDGVEELINGMNMSVFYIGASFAGKEKLADGTKAQLPLSQYLVDRIFNSCKRKNRNVQFRLHMFVIINEKVYDCFSDNKTATLKLREQKWQGFQPDMCKTIQITTPQDFGAQLSRAIKQKNRLVMQFKDMYSTHLVFQVIQKDPTNQRQNMVSKLNIFEIAGLQCLNNAHSSIKIKDSPSSSRSLIGFSHLVSELAKFPDTIIHYEGSQLTKLLKEIVGMNSTLYAFLNLKVSDIDGSLATLKFLKPLENIEQFPIINNSLNFGTIRRFRHWAMNSGLQNQNDEIDDEKKQLQEEMLRLQAEQDYKRLLEKYGDLKQKYAAALKAKSQAQLQLIKSQEQKLQIGKSLVQLQIENTKLLQKLQNKDYENGKRLLNAQNQLAQRQMSYQQCLDRINQLKQSLDQALQTKKDLQIQFIALKRNFLIQQKQVKQLREDNQNLGLDVINLSKDNEKLKKQLMNGDGFGRKSMIKHLEEEKVDELRRANKSHEDNIAYLRSEIQRYKKELLQFQMNANSLSPQNGDEFGKDYRRIELQNENMELLNKQRLHIRKIQQLDQKIGYYMQENQQLQEQVRDMKIKDTEQTEQYRQKMGRYAKNTNSQAVVKELKTNFSRKDRQNLDKINSLKRDISEKKNQIINLRGYARELIALLEEWGPKGLDVPSIKKYKNMDLTGQRGTEALEELRIRNIRLEEEVRRMKEFSSPNFKESRVIEITQNLHRSNASHHSSSELTRLRQQKNDLAQQNRKLTILLKDGNKMDLNILKKQNQSLKKQLENLKNNSSISPSTYDQKLKFYQKHIKLLQKQRSQLLSRSVVAQQQLKNLTSKLQKAKMKL